MIDGECRERIGSTERVRVTGRVTDTELAAAEYPAILVEERVDELRTYLHGIGCHVVGWENDHAPIEGVTITVHGERQAIDRPRPTDAAWPTFAVVMVSGASALLGALLGGWLL